VKCDGTRAETRIFLSAKRTSPFKSAGASVQTTTGSRDVRISGSNAGYTSFRGSVKSTGYPLHSQVSPSLPLSCVTVYHHISTGLHFTYVCSAISKAGNRRPLSVDTTFPALSSQVGSVVEIVAVRRDFLWELILSFIYLFIFDRGHPVVL